MPTNPALDDILELTDRSASGRLSLVGSRVIKSASAARTRIIRNASGACSLRLCKASQTGRRAYDDVDLSAAIVREAIGIPDAPPGSGTFPLAPIPAVTSGLLVSGKRYLIVAFVAGDSFTGVGAASNASGVVFTATGTTPAVWTHGSSLQELTTELDVAASYLEWTTALNLTAGLLAAGGVTVTNPTLGAYRVTFNNFGAQPEIVGPITAGMSPAAVVSVSRVVQGSAKKHEVQLIRLLALPYCFATLATPFPVAAAVIETKQAATTDVPQIVRLTLDPMPYDGSMLLGLDDKPKFLVPYNASEEQIAALSGPTYSITKRAGNAWDIAGVAPNQAVVVTCDVTGLLVAKGVTGVMPLNTDGIFQAFAVDNAKWKKFTREISVQFPGEEPTKVLLEEVELWRDLLDLGSIVPPIMPGLQFVASNLIGTPWVYTTVITALTGGTSFCLDAVDLTTLALGTRYDFPISGIVQTWLVKAGDADPADPTGQVHWVNYNSGAPATDKHWEKAA